MLDPRFNRRKCLKEELEEMDSDDYEYLHNEEIKNSTARFKHSYVRSRW